MPLTDEILSENQEICQGPFTVNAGHAIPSIQDLPLGSNQGRQLNLVALFVDIRRSTALVHALGLVRAARMYKAYMRGITKLVRARGGELLSFNGDGVAAGFVGDNAASAACLTGLNLNWFLSQVLKPRVDTTLRELHAESALVFDFGIGIELGDVLVVRGGVRGEENSDLVWAGNPLNFAVKLSGLGSMPYTLHISNSVFGPMHHSLFGDGHIRFWEAWTWTDKSLLVWRSNWWFRPDYVETVPGSSGIQRRRLLPPPN